jgi:polyphosphate kinase
MPGMKLGAHAQTSCAESPPAGTTITGRMPTAIASMAPAMSSSLRARFAIRQIDPVRRWKLSPMGLESLDRWDDYTKAKKAMLLTTDTEYAQWTSIKSNDKKRARINAMRFFLNQFDFEDKNPEVVYPADKLLVQRGRDAVD